MFPFAMMLMVFGNWALHETCIYLSRLRGSGGVAFTSLFFGIILLLVGGGLLCSTVAEAVKKLMAR